MKTPISILLLVVTFFVNQHSFSQTSNKTSQENTKQEHIDDDQIEQKQNDPNKSSYQISSDSEITKRSGVNLKNVILIVSNISGVIYIVNELKQINLKLQDLFD